MLVFVAMIIVGIFIINSLEIQQNNQIEREMLNQAKKINFSLALKNEQLDSQTQKIESLFQNWPVGIDERIYLLTCEENPVIITGIPRTTEIIVDARAYEHDELDAFLIMQGNKGTQIFKNIENIDKTGIDKHLVYPVENEIGEQVAIIYVMNSLKKNYALLDATKIVLLEATLIALVVTIILGYLVARSITKPINAVTLKAEKMAKGDFNQYVDVQSTDEIGQLGRMFNYLNEGLKKSISEINREKSKMEAILNYMADGLIAVNKEGVFIHANLVAQDMFNLESKAIDTYKYRDIIEGSFESLRLKKIFEEESATGSKLIEHDGKVYKVQYAPFFANQTEVSGLILVFQDMTEEEKLERLRRDFVANVSHELKTPLTTVKSYTETIIDGVGNPELERSFLETINSECDRMNRIVRELLDLSSMDHKQKKWNFEKANISYLLEKCVKKMNMTAKEKNQELRFDVVSETPEIVFDYDGIEQVVLNIISNAIKYSHEGGHVEVQLYQNGYDVVIEIKDDGFGIDKKDLNRIFERFYRVDKARSRALGGTGLGLSIAKEIMEAHEGSIHVQSQLGVGTTVFLNLPID
jgi:two-component system sensor histidine kinase VicK